MCTSVVTPFYAFVDLFWIYVAVSTYSMYKKFEKESRLGTNFELTSINAAVNPQMSGQSMQSNFQQNLKMSAAQ